MIYTGPYHSYHWWIFRGGIIYTRAYPAHRWCFLLGWCLALRHSQFASSRGLWWVRSSGMTLHWGIAISDGVFIGDTVTLLDTLHWDTLYSSMVGFWDDDFIWGVALSLVMHFDWSLEHSHFSWFILGHSHHVHIHGARGFWFLWITLRCFRFGTRSRGWLIYWLEYTTLHWGIAGTESIFHWSIATLFGSFTLGNVHLLEGDQIGSWHWALDEW